MTLYTANHLRRLLVAALSTAGLAAASSSATAAVLTDAELALVIEPLPWNMNLERVATLNATPKGFSHESDVVSLLPGTSFSGAHATVLRQGPEFRLGDNPIGVFNGPPFNGPMTVEAIYCTSPLSTGHCLQENPFAFGGAMGMYTDTTFWGTVGPQVLVTGTQVPWETGVVTAGGTFTLPLIATGSNMLTTLSGNGQITLVTPIRFRVYDAWLGGLITEYRGLASLELTFAPEPAFGALLGAGALFLAWRGMRSSRSTARRGSEHRV